MLFGVICAYLECVADHGKNLKVSYKLSVLNEKDSAKSLQKVFSLYTKTGQNTCSYVVSWFIKFLKIWEENYGFLNDDAVIIYCEILDYKDVEVSFNSTQLVFL